MLGKIFSRYLNSKYLAILEKEISIFKPNLIIGLGVGDIKKKVDKSIIEKYKINVMSHPTNGNINKTKDSNAQIAES